MTISTLAWVLSAAVAASPVPPTPTRWVTDEAGFLSPATREALDAKLAGYEQRTGHQLLVWIGRTTGGVPIEDFAVKAFAAWRVGRKGIDDGLVLFVMADDRTTRIEVGYGLEDKVPDAIASRIIRDDLVPGFQSGQRDAAVTRAVDALIATIEGGAPPAAAPAGRLPVTSGQLVLFALVALAFLILFITNPSLALSLLFILASGKRRGGGGIGGMPGGGGFHGGGGRSGGGGASGSW